MKAADRLAVVRDEGRAALDNLKSVLQFIDAQKPSPALRIVMVNSAIVAAVSVVEEVIRQLFLEYLRIVEERIDSHRKLRGELRESNATKSILEIREYLKIVNEVEAIRVLERLQSCLKGEIGYVLAKEKIVENEGNYRSGQLTDVAKRIGLPEIWTKIADDAAVASRTGQPVGDLCKNRLIGEWNSIFDERDLVVHKVSQASGWASAKVVSAIDLFVLITDRLATCLAADLISIIPPEA